MNKALILAGSIPLLTIALSFSQNNTNTGANAAIVAGTNNTNAASRAAILAGNGNTIFGPTNNAFIGAGNFNTISAGVNNGAIIAGYANTIGQGSRRSVIVGGTTNAIGEASHSSTISGGEFNTISSLNPLLIVTPETALMATISGGGNNLIGPNGRGATIGGGSDNQALQASAVVGGGAFNQASGTEATVGGGRNNIASGLASTISGGSHNHASENSSVVSGGSDNVASGWRSTVGGGAYNEASGLHATVPGGFDSIASGNFSFAAGRSASAEHEGAFVWGDSTEADISSTADNQATFRAVGGVRMITAVAGAGAQLAANATSWSVMSDKEAKENFQDLNPAEMLEKLARLPITKWNYKHDPGRVYIGPTSQDFAQAFGLGSDDKSIATIDTDGVLLSAMQGLVAELKDRDEKMRARDKKISQLETVLSQAIERMSALEKQVESALPPAP